MRLENNRAGELKKMQSDYECFVPHNLKDIKLNLDSEINALINKAYFSIWISIEIPFCRSGGY